MSYCPKGISDLSLCPWVYSHHLGSSQHYLLPGLQWQLTGFPLSTLPPCNPFSTQSLRTQTGEYCCLSHNSLFPWLQRSYTMARAHFFNEMFDCFSPYSPHYTHTGFSLVSGTHQALSCLLALALLFPLPRNIFISASHDWFLFSLWFLETSSHRPACKALLSSHPSVILLSGLPLFPSWHLLSEITWFISSFTSLSSVYLLEISTMMVRMLSCSALCTLSLAQYPTYNKLSKYSLNKWMNSQGTGCSSISGLLSLLWNAQNHKIELNSPSKIINLPSGSLRLTKYPSPHFDRDHVYKYCWVFKLFKCGKTANLNRLLSWQCWVNRIYYPRGEDGVEASGLHHFENSRDVHHASCTNRLWPSGSSENLSCIHKSCWLLCGGWIGMRQKGVWSIC